MKKAIAVFFAFLMLLGLSAQAEAQPLTVDELIAYWDQVREAALAQENPAVVEQNEDGEFMHAYDQLLLISEEDTLTADSPMRYAEVMGEGLPVLRGVGIGSTLEEILAAYPLDNEALAGTFDEAALYISGMLPGAVSFGSLWRSGSQVSQVEYDVITPDETEAEQCFIGYVLENGVVISVYTGVSRMPLSAAEVDVDSISRLQEEREYTAPRDAQVEPLAREDLLFVCRDGALDFVSANSETLISLLGEPLSDQVDTEEGRSLRTMEWESAVAVLTADQDAPEALLSLKVYGDQLEGPRGLHMNDSLESVLARFPHEGETALYGDGQTAPYGVLTEGAEGHSVVLAVQAEEKTVLLTLDFVDDALWVITCACQ